jgi:hypothetical protein
LREVGQVFVEGDVNGNGRADFRIDVHGASTLFHNDFVLYRHLLSTPQGCIGGSERECNRGRAPGQTEVQLRFT